MRAWRAARVAIMGLKAMGQMMARNSTKVDADASTQNQLMTRPVLCASAV